MKTKSKPHRNFHSHERRTFNSSGYMDVIERRAPCGFREPPHGRHAKGAK